eukprot:jgi/Mesvir1/15127/Mv14762-RA.2
MAPIGAGKIIAKGALKGVKGALNFAVKTVSLGNLQLNGPSAKSIEVSKRPQKDLSYIKSVRTLGLDRMVILQKLQGGVPRATMLELANQMPVVTAIFVAWIAGTRIFTGILPIVLACYVTWKLAEKQKRRALEEAKLRWRLEVAEVLPETVTESAEWFNKLIATLWPRLLEPWITVRMSSMIVRKLSKTKPAMVDSAELSSFYLGKQPFAVTGAQVLQHAGQRVTDLDIEFIPSDMRIEIKLTLQLGIGGKVPVTVQVGYLSIRGKLRLRFFPSHRVMLMSFTSKPDVKMDLKLVGVNITGMPIIEKWLSELVKSELSRSLVEPRRSLQSIPFRPDKSPSIRLPRPPSGVVTVHLLNVQYGGPLSGGDPVSPESPSEGTGQEKGGPWPEVTVEVRLGSKRRSVTVPSKEDMSHDDVPMGESVDTGLETVPVVYHLQDTTSGSVNFSVKDTSEGQQREAANGFFQFKWMTDGSTTLWYNGRDQVPTAVRVKEGTTYTATISLTSASSGHTEVGLLHLIFEPCWESGVAEAEGTSPAAAAYDPHSGVIEKLLASRTATWVVQLVEGRDLVAKDANGKSDPYCKLSLGEKKRISKAMPNTLEPKWDQEFRFPAVGGSGDRLTLSCYDRDFVRGMSDDFLGSLQVDLTKYRDGHIHDMWLKLQATASGEVRLKILYEDIINVGEPLQSLQLKKASSVPSGLLKKAIAEETLKDTSSPSRPAHSHTMSAQLPNTPPPLPEEDDVFGESDPSLSAESSNPTSGQEKPVHDHTGTSRPSSRAPSVPPSPRSGSVTSKMGRLDSFVDSSPPPPASVPGSSTWRLSLSGLQAKNLEGRNLIGLRSDPYLKIRIGKYKQYTKVRDSTCDPVWDKEVFRFFLPNKPTPGVDTEDSQLIIECKDKNLVGAVSLGTCVIDLRKISTDKVHDQWYPLSGVSRGQLHVRLALEVGGGWQ